MPDTKLWDAKKYFLVVISLCLYYVLYYQMYWILSVFLSTSNISAALTRNWLCSLMLMSPSPLGHVEDRCPLHGAAERQVGSLTVITSFSLSLLPTTLAHLCLSSMPGANYPAPIVLCWMHPMPMGKKTEHSVAQHSLLDNLKTWKDSLSLDSRNRFLSCIVDKENTQWCFSYVSSFSLDTNWS